MAGEVCIVTLQVAGVVGIVILQVSGVVRIVILQATGTATLFSKHDLSVHGRHLLEKDESEDGVGTETGIVGSEALPQTQHSFPTDHREEDILNTMETIYMLFDRDNANKYVLSLWCSLQSILIKVASQMLR